MEMLSEELHRVVPTFKQVADQESGAGGMIVDTLVQPD